MDEDEVRHEKVRFRRDEIVRLDHLPSAAARERVVDGPHLRARVAPVLGWSLAGLLAIACAIPLYLLFVGIPGPAGERLRFEAEAALTRMAGFDVDAAMGAPRLSVDGARLLGVQINDVSIASGVDGAVMLEAGTIRFGLRLLPLVSGDLRLGSAGIQDARLSLANLPARDGRPWLTAVTGEHGLVEPSLLMREVFASLHRLFDAFEQGTTRRLDLANVEIILPPGAQAHTLMIRRAAADRASDGRILFEADAELDGNALAFTGEATRPQGSTSIERVLLSLETDPVTIVRPPAQGDREMQFRIERFTGAVSLRLEGAETGGGSLALTGALNDASVGFANGDTLAGSGTLAAVFDARSEKVEIEKALLLVGRSRFEFHGAAGPDPASDDRSHRYRFELVSDGSLLAPHDGTEPDLPFLARIAGGFDLAEMRLAVEEIGVRTGRGEVLGKAMVTFAPGLSPGLDLVLSVPEMPVAHAKQIWPWFAANGAQKWATANVFGGMVRGSSLSMSVPPGRIGDGTPLSRNEISGRFAVSGVRFDVTGQIPPVRDASGTIEFRGTDVDIALDTGTIYMATGRTVAARDGTLTIRDGHEQPVFGDLAIDVDGDAGAIAELATYKPIDALRHLPIAPDDLSGAVKGQVQARIPLQLGIDPDDLGWTVKLAYEGLAIAKPVEGQRVTDAKGTIEVTPDLATIKAEARLNGMPSTLEITEPLGDSGARRIRTVSMTLDDKTRQALAPGLDSLLSGPVTARVSINARDGLDVVADLTAARLSLPWVGWTKGAGVKATLTFSLDQSGSETNLQNIVLEGASFSIAGDATLAGSDLVRANMRSVRLNRSDDLRVEIRKSGAGYALTVRGKSFDGRGLIKQILSDPGQVTAKARGVPIQLDAEIDTIVGFDAEALVGLKIAYRGTGASVNSLDASGRTRAGATVALSDKLGDGMRRVSLRSSDAGSLLRFLDIYQHMQGGQIGLDLAGTPGGVLKGQVEARNFALVNEPRLRSIVATAPPGDTRSLNDAVRRDIDTSRVEFERGFVRVEKGPGSLSVDNGVLRGPVIGTTFQGSVYDPAGKMAITGTFMPAYGLNRLFAEIPLFGQLLGNGRDRGLIGITYRVAGDLKSPQVQVNPISAIAPGIFRSIFEFN